jgi:hypothetical protein
MVPLIAGRISSPSENIIGETGVLVTDGHPGHAGVVKKEEV